MGGASFILAEYSEDEYCMMSDFLLMEEEACHALPTSFHLHSYTRVAQSYDLITG